MQKKQIYTNNKINMNLLSNIYVVTIKRNLDRQVWMTKLLSRHNLQFSFIEGIDGLQLNSNTLKSIFDVQKKDS